MSKISLIIQREYTTRVRKKSFLIMTLLSPVLLAIITFLPIWLSGIQNSDIKDITIIDHTEKYNSVFHSNENYHFQYINNTQHKIPDRNNNHAFVIIEHDLLKNPNAVTIYSEQQVSLELKSYISSQLSSFVKNEKLSLYHIPHLKEIIENSKTDIHIKTAKWGKNGKLTETSSEIALAVGMISTLLIYIFILVYGAQVMRGVVEEKSNRIIEVIISSVRPFELMMGKIIGIALVGLTQFVFWIILTGIFWGLMAHNGILASHETTLFLSSSNAEPFLTNLFIEQILSTINFTELIFIFILYFLGGYLLYASLFAAIGAISDNETDTQQFILPITIPIIFALYTAMYSANNPDSSFAFWCSIVPFTSPIVMMARIPLGVPYWQIVLSFSILIISFIGSTWLAGKVYRTGILMYGKKVNYKEICKWIRYK